MRRHSGTTDPKCLGLLRRHFSESIPHRVLVTDITEFKTREENLYLCMIKEVYNGTLVSWKMALRATAEFVMEMDNIGESANRTLGTTVKLTNQKVVNKLSPFLITDSTYSLRILLYYRSKRICYLNQITIQVHHLFIGDNVSSFSVSLILQLPDAVFA